MRVFIPLLFAVALIVVLGAIELALLRVFNPLWWCSRLVRRAAIALPLFGVLAVVAWGLGEYYTIAWLAGPSAVLSALSCILLVALMLSLPLSGIVHFVRWLFDRITRRHHSEHGTTDSGRRLFLKTTAAAVPVVALTAGLSGVGRAMAGANVYLRVMKFDHLPGEIIGLRILHLSDLHLHHYVTLDSLESVLIDAEQFSPDIVVVTGDVADDLHLLPDALSMIDGLRAPLGSFACLGNHEYFRGITHVRRIHDSSPVPLLINDGVRLSVGETAVYIAGLDDPRRLGGGDERFYQKAIDQAMQASQSDDFLLLLSHRPEAIEIASKYNIPLTLAGHTHGGQIGLFGRSLLEPVWPHRYFWGSYRVGCSQLYTSAGVGHWFPFRLGCPPEAPVIELQRV